MKRTFIFIIAIAVFVASFGVFYKSCASEVSVITEENFGLYMGGTLGFLSHKQAWEKEIELAKDLGIKYVRFNSDMWSVLEPEKGKYNWQPLDSLVTLLEQNDLKMLFTIPISNERNSSIPEGYAGAVPLTHFPARDIQEIENFCYEIASRYKGRINYYEAWNEPDLWLFWKGEPNAEEYAQVLKAMYKGLKKGNPECTVLAGGLVNPWDAKYLKQLLRYGAEDYFDVVNIHIYTKNMYMVQIALNTIKNAMSENNINKPLWVTEISTTPDYFKSNDLEKEELDKAKMLVKSYSYLLSEGVDKIFWHTLRNAGVDAGLDKNFDFGLVTYNFDILPAYQSMKILLENILSSSPEGDIKAKEEVFFYKFGKQDQDVFVGWTLFGRGRIKMQFEFAYAVMDIFGQIKESSTGGEKRIRLKTTPVIVTAEKM